MGLVSELHEAVLSVDKPASQLLRYAITAAARLNDHEMLDWAQTELKGYGERKVPEYRIAKGQLMATDSFGRHLPCTFSESSKLQARLESCPMHYPLPEIEDFVVGATQDSMLQVYFEPETEQKLRRTFKGAMSVFRVIQVGQCKRILSAVRDRIFQWSLDLQKNNTEIEGTFQASSRRVEEASVAHTGAGRMIQADNYIHVEGLSQSPFQIQPIGSTQSVSFENLDLDAVSRAIASLSQELAATQSHSTIVQELKNELQTIKGLLDAPKKKTTWIAEGLNSVRKILEEAAGHLLAEGVKAGAHAAEIGRILGL